MEMEVDEDCCCACVPCFKNNKIFCINQIYVVVCLCFIVSLLFLFFKELVILKYGIHITCPIYYPFLSLPHHHTLKQKFTDFQYSNVEIFKKNQNKQKNFHS